MTHPRRWGLLSGGLMALAACQSGNLSTPPPPADPAIAPAAAAPNLVALFLAKRDNLQDEFRGEIYPLALYLNGGFVDVSQDLTLSVRGDFPLDRLVELNRPQSFLTVVPEFTVLAGDRVLGQFTVKQLGASQFACSTYLVGQGQFQGEPSLAAMYEALPPERSASFAGNLGGQAFDEAWRWTLAISTHHTLPATNLDPTTDRPQREADLQAAAAAAIAADETTRDVQGNDVVETLQVFDLERDGTPEVFGVVRRGPAPQSLPPGTRPDAVGIVYVNLWLRYANGQPTVLSRDVLNVQFPVSRQPYTLAGTLDITGDGVAEVVIQNNNYEGRSYSILRLQDDQLQRVFTGAAYGC